MSVCRRVLDRREDAEDAAQETFMALFRYAGKLRNRRVLGSWLYCVANRTAIQMKVESARRRAMQSQAGEKVPPRRAEDAAAFRELLRQLLHDEVHCLPADYRTLVSHYYLEGRSNEEVGRITGRPIGTVKGQLWRARGMLRERLSSRVGGALELFA